MPSPGLLPPAIVFDFDGTLVDTEWCWATSERALFHHLGKPFGLAERQALHGRSLDDAGHVLAALLDCPGRESQLADELGARAEQLIMSSPRLLPGAAALVNWLDGRTRLGIASNTRRSTVVNVLEQTALSDFFHVVVGADDVHHPKPSPDVYLKACAQLGTQPNVAVAIEDSPVGVKAARAAGLYVIGIPSVPGTRLDADLVVSSLEDSALRIQLRLADSRCPPGPS